MGIYIYEKSYRFSFFINFEVFFVLYKPYVWKMRQMTMVADGEDVFEG